MSLCCSRRTGGEGRSGFGVSLFWFRIIGSSLILFCFSEESSCRALKRRTNHIHLMTCVSQDKVLLVETAAAAGFGVGKWCLLTALSSMLQ